MLCSHRNTFTRRCMLTEWVEGLGESLALREGKGMSPTGCTAFHPACPNSHRCQAHLAACTSQSLGTPPRKGKLRPRL